MFQQFNMFNYAATLGRMISGMKYRPSRAIRRLEHQGEASWPGSTARAARAGERPCCGAGCDINDVRQPLGRHLFLGAQKGTPRRSLAYMFTAICLISNPVNTSFKVSVRWNDYIWS